MTTANIIDMTTLDCPYGCGEKLAISFAYKGWEDTATCSNVTGWNGDECEGFGVFYKDGDAVQDTVWERVRQETKWLKHWQAEVQDTQDRIRQLEKKIRRINKLGTRISRQHG